MPTRKTLFWVAAAVLLYMIAWNVGSGWLYVLTTFLLALPFVSILLSYINIGRIAFELAAPRSVTPGERLPVTLQVINRSLLPRFFLDVDLKYAGSRHRLFLPVLGPRQRIPVAIDLRGIRRGIYSGAEVSLSSAAPVGLARRRRKAETASPIVVYPRWHSLASDWNSGQKNAGYMVSSAIPTRNTASDYLGVRDYRSGDSPRSIHWRTSARTNNLAVIEYARQAAITPVFLVDTFAEGDRGKDAGSTFESAVSIAASLAHRECRHNRRFAIGASPGNAGEEGLGATFDEAMLWLAGAEAASDKPMDLTENSLPWPEVTPVLILTSHAAYAGLDRTDFIQDFPHAIVIMLDGRGFEKGGRPGRELMDDNELEALAGRMESLGSEFFLIASTEEAELCLSDL